MSTARLIGAVLSAGHCSDTASCVEDQRLWVLVTPNESCYVEILQARRVTVQGR